MRETEGEREPNCVCLSGPLSTFFLTHLIFEQYLESSWVRIKQILRASVTVIAFMPMQVTKRKWVDIEHMCYRDRLKSKPREMTGN